MVLVSFIDPPITLAMHSILVIRPVPIIADAGNLAVDNVVGLGRTNVRPARSLDIGDQGLEVGSDCTLNLHRLNASGKR
jgi:hypothetical protein